jgi:GT2 family glycosyltransferase
MTDIVFPRTARPEATVVIPVHGREDWTRKTLAALLEHTKLSYEVVLVDDASPDAAGERVARGVAGVTVLHNTRNLGFGASCNRGALVARGRDLVFLNSDALPHEGWLEPLLAMIARPGIGAAGPKILNLDGSLQQAGVLVGGDGRTEFYGYGDDPNDEPYVFARVVDYVSGACVAIRRTLFTSFGGFDPAYGVGYYEDADLCLRLRESGYETWYEPRSVVTHVHRASSAEADAIALSDRNRAVFALRRRAGLAGRAPLQGADERGRLTARDAPADGSVLAVGLDDDRVLDALALQWPRVRTTVLALGAEARARLETETARADDAEEATAFLASRRFAYDVLLVAESVPASLRNAFAATQPQAVVVEASDAAGLVEPLVSAGLPPGR